MSALKPELSLYHLTLKAPSASVKSIVGSFSGNKRQQELVVVHSSSLELWKIDTDTGKLVKVTEHDCFSVIRSVSTFRTPGSAQDCLLVTSDAGNISVVQLNGKTMRFETAQNQPYFKTGVRRLSPGAYIAVDARGRAAMVAAIERNKLVYTLRRDSNDKLLISSPLEANRNKVLTFDVVALDVGFDNPVFAAVECDYGAYEGKSIRTESGLEYTKQLTFYELDLGLNHVVRKASHEISKTTSFLLPVPGGNDGPSGVLVCSENMIQYQGMHIRTHHLPIPKRTGSSCSCSIVAGVCHKMKGSFFAILQSDSGDLFKVTLDYDAETRDVSSIQIKYFDTVPVCSSLVIFKSGFLFADCEHGDKYLYQFEGLGDGDDRTWSSTDYPDDVAVLEDQDVEYDVKQLENLSLVDIHSCLNPLIDAKVLYGAADFPTIISATGTGARSALRTAKHELPHSELVSSELPAAAERVLTTKVRASDEFDSYIVLSFEDATLILSIGETVEEVSNTGFVTNSPTIAVQQVGSSSVVQVYPGGIRHVTYSDSDSEPRIVDWFPPSGTSVLVASTTPTQVVVGLSNRELAYFEVDETDQLIEYNERKETSAKILSLSLGEVPNGKLRSPFIAVGCNDKTISILSTDPESTLEYLTREDLSGSPTDALITWMVDSLDDSARSLFLHLGLDNGIYSKISLDPATGSLSSPRNIFTGPKAVKLSKVAAFDQTMVAVNSSRSYLSFLAPSGPRTVPLAGPALTSIHRFKSEDCPENGLIAVHSNTLTIFTVDSIAHSLAIEALPLKYTPRCLEVTEEVAYVGQSEVHTDSKVEGDGEVVVPFDEEESGYHQQFGYGRSDHWASCIQAVSLANNSVVQTIELLGNESITRCCRVSFNHETFLVVATSLNQKLLPNTNDGAALHTYRILKNNTLELVHVTKADGVILALAEFQGKLVVGVKNMLVLYDLGQKQLLRRGAFDTGLRAIVSIQSQGFRLIVGDSQQSVKYVVYKPANNSFVAFADDTVPRATTSLVMLDYDTVIGGDKFGNVWVLRCPEDVSEASDEDPFGANISAKPSFLQGAPYRLDTLNHFYVQDIPTSFSRGPVAIGGSDVVVYTGLQGTIGAFIPITSLRDVNFFMALEKYIAEEYEEMNLTGRSHSAYRGYYIPKKGVVDGDLLEMYFKLADGQKVKIANKMDRLPREVEKKISEMRNRYAF